MADLSPVDEWTNIYQLETSDPVLGGSGGVSNRQAQQLLNRTERIYQTSLLAGINHVNGTVSDPTTTTTGPARRATQTEVDNRDDLPVIVTPDQIPIFADQTSVDTGTATDEIVTPATLAGRQATESLSGITELATQTEVNTGTDTSRIVTPATLQGKINSLSIPVGIDTTWKIASYQSGFTTASTGYNRLRYRLMYDGRQVQIMGRVSRTNTTSTLLTVMTGNYVPSSSNDVSQQRYVIGGTEYGVLEIQNNGNIYVYGLPATTINFIDINVIFTLD